MSEEILLNVTPARVMVDPGGSAQVVLQVQNRTAVVDDLMIEVLGDAANWTVLDRSQVAVFPDGVDTVQVTIQPPRAARPAAGTVAVGFRVRSTVNPTLSTVEECSVVVKPFVEIAGEIAPKTARGRFSATHNLRVINKGNAPVNVSVRAEVQQGDCQIAVPPGSLLVDRGQRTTAKIKVRPSSSRWQGGDEMHSYRLNVEPQGGAPVAIDAMMRQRPILGVPIATLLVAALLVVGGLAIYGKGPGAPIRTALRWTGMVDVAPSPTPVTEVQATSAPTQQAVVSAASPSQAAAPTPSPSSAPTPASTPHALPSGVTIIHPLPILFCTTLSTVNLTDATSPGATSTSVNHTLKWTSNGTCAGTYTGTIVETWHPRYCLFGLPCGGTVPFAVSGANGTTSPPIAVGTTVASVSFVLTLSDGNGHTATSAAAP